MSSPNVVIMSQFTPSYDNLNVGFKSKKEICKSAMNMFDYYADNKKKAFYMLDYFSGKIGKEKEMNIVFEDGHYATKKEIEIRKKQYKKYIEHSNLYKLVISFPSGFLEKNVNIKEFEKNLAKNIIPMFLRKCGFQNINKMSYQFSLHTNTDNLHFHFSFAEKKANFKYKNGKIQYRTKGELSQEELNFFKNEIEHYIYKEKIFTPLLKETNKDIDKLKQYFNPKDKNYLLSNKDSILLEDKIMKLGELLSDKRDNERIKFNSIKNKEIIKLTKEIKREIFNNKISSQSIDYDIFLSSLSKINQYYDLLSKNNNINFKDYTLTLNKKKYIDNYIYNAIVNHALMEYKTSQNQFISDENILQEIIYNKYKNKKLSSKYNILTNYLKYNKFSNKREIIQSIKNINKELESAEEEFFEMNQKNRQRKNYTL